MIYYSKKIKDIKAELLYSYIFIKKNIYLKEKLDKEFVKKRNKYKECLEKYTVYQIYNIVINKMINNIDIMEKQEYTELYVSIPDINISKDPYKYNEKKFLNIPNTIIDEIYKFNIKQLNLYNKIVNSDKKNKKDILEYLENKKNKDIKKQITKIKNKKTINYVLLND